MVVEIAADAVEAVCAVDATCAVSGALPAVTVGGVDCVVKNGARGEAETVELDVTSIADKAVFGGTAGEAVGLARHAIIIICARLQAFVVGLRASEQTSVVEDIVPRTALQANGER